MDKTKAEAQKATDSETKTKDKKQYKTTTITVKSSEKKLMQYCEEQTKAAKLFKNAVTFRCRQIVCAHHKVYENLSDNEYEVLAEFANIDTSFMFAKYWTLPNYNQFDAMFKITNNPDYYNELAQQSNQQMIKEVLESFKGYKESLFAYRENPSKFTGNPKLPGYVKSDRTTCTITNQDAKIKDIYKKVKVQDGFTKRGKPKYKNVKVYDKTVLKLPKTKAVVELGDLNIGKLKEVQIEPFYDTYRILIIEELPKKTEKLDLDDSRILGIDLGISNFVSTSNNCGLTPFVINGNGIKSYNQWYNKTLANLQSNLPTNQHSSRAIQQLNQKRYNVTTDFYNKTARYVVDYCIKNNIGLIAVGKNNGWKDESNLGNITNQSFCFLAHSVFIAKLQNMAKMAGIKVVLGEESFTSKASFLDDDYIPTYQKGCTNKYYFSGHRVHRGLYKSAESILINADVNGASNIIKKAVPNAFDHIADFSYLCKTTIKVDLYKRDKELQILNRKTKVKTKT